MPALSAAIRRLERRQAQAPALIEPAVKSLDAALHALEETRAHLEAALRAADYDPAELERIEERLFALRAAARKYNVPVDELAALAAKYQADIALIDAGEDRLKQLETAAHAGRVRLPQGGRRALQGARQGRRRARQGGQCRAQAAQARTRAVLDRRSTATRPPPARTASTASSSGCETNPGTRPGPLMKVASGGELARFLLALKVVLADRGSAPTLVFDEIDTGVGGAVADAIGVRLARLARGVQVLAVTHAPQVAARAERHYLISKDALDKGKRVATRVAELAADKRREEIARMLAGAEITNEARAAAERLIKAASWSRHPEVPARSAEPRRAAAMM